MSKYIRQHYVPQSYLKRFTPDGERIYVYDKFGRKAFGPTDVSNVAQERYFYDVPLDAWKNTATTANLNPHLEEEALRELENRFHCVIDSAIAFASGQGSVPTPNERLTMSLCMAVQLVRTRAYRNMLVETEQKLTEITLNNALKLMRPDLTEQVRVTVRDYGRADEAILHGRYMWNPDFVCQLAATFNSHIWFLGVNRTGVPLYTSDAPVVIRGLDERTILKPRPDIGPAYERAIDIVVELAQPPLNSKGIQIIYPLNPQYALILLERTHFAAWERYDGKRLPLGIADVRSYNELQVRQSYRQVYSSTNDFHIAEAVSNENPEVCLPIQEKVRVNTWEWTAEDQIQPTEG